jgi:hypothetical protein
MGRPGRPRLTVEQLGQRKRNREQYRLDRGRPPRPATPLINGLVLPFSESWIRFSLLPTRKKHHQRAASPLHVIWLEFKVATGTR